MDLVLVGLPGSGKSAVGRRIAQRHHATFVDLDELVESQTGRKVPEIFAAEGEAGFRRHEHEAVVSLGPADTETVLRRVISTGGGSVIDPRNRWLLYAGRVPMWLDAQPEILASRLSHSANVRPLVAGHDPAGSLRKLAADRRRFYAPATQASGMGNVEAVMRAIEKRLAEGPSQAVTLLRADTAIGRVELGRDIAADAVDSALRRADARRAILISEPKSWAVAGAGLAADLESRGWQIETIQLPQGEDAKRMLVVEDTCRTLSRLRVDRREPLVAIGGGALTDAAGFAAATYLRGVPIIQVPTTLVGQIDAALGGKTAVDIPEGKNLIGAFHQPIAFIADVAFLTTLPARQRRAALGEVVKMGVLGDERLLQVVEADGAAFAAGSNEPIRSGVAAEMVERCAWTKVEVVTADEKEGGLRKTLNLGHTIGHGVEAAAGYHSILHGEAVAYGLRAAFAISLAMGITTPERSQRINDLLDRLGLAVDPPAVTRDSVWEHVAADKKYAHGRLSWVLPTETGVVVRSDVPDDAVEAGLAAALRLDAGASGPALSDGAASEVSAR